MKIYPVLCFGAAMVLSQLTMAEPVSPPSLGQLEGILDFCSKVDSKSAPKYHERAKAMLGETSEKDMAKARKSDDYKKAYDWISEELQKTPKQDATKACTDFLEEK